MIVAAKMKRKTIEKPAPTVVAQVEEPQQVGPQTVSWSPVLRVAFRFSFLYFSLFALATQISGSLLLTPSASFRGFGHLWPMRSVTIWFAEHIFGVTEPLVYGRNSGETLFYWIQTFWLLTF